MKKLPRSVTIAGVKWRVLIEPRHPEESDTFGETDSTAYTITIYSEPHAQFGNDIRATLFHECLHAALRSTGLAHLITTSEEAIVTGLEASLFPLVNRGLFD